MLASASGLAPVLWSERTRAPGGVERVARSTDLHEGVHRIARHRHGRARVRALEETHCREQGRGRGLAPAGEELD
jgi:hypothetical protein